MPVPGAGEGKEVQRKLDSFHVSSVSSVMFYREFASGVRLRSKAGA